ncbi:MAG: DUF2848 domain-containing protein [Rhodospirillales bacterium]
MRFHVQELSGDETVIEVNVTEVVIGGWTGRDQAAVQHHIDELADIGVPAPSTTPLFYRVGVELLTQSAYIQTVGDGGSGEVEAVLIGTATGTLVAVGSDHTDRKAEAWSVALSKQLCCKPISSQAWRLNEVLAVWDEICLQSAQEQAGETVDYQDGVLGSCRRPEEMIKLYTGADELAEGTVLFLGTIPVIGEIKGGEAFAMRLFDPAHDRTLQHAYRVEALPVIS